MRWAKLVVLALIFSYLFIGWSVRERVFQGSSDFISYYTAARMIRDGQGSALYDLARQTFYQDEILSSLHSPNRFSDGLLAYNHPPFEILWYVPLGGLSYIQAYSVWLLVSAGCFVGGVWQLIHSTGLKVWAEGKWFLVGSMAYLPVFITLLQGQDSATLFLFWVLAYHNLKKARDVRAGFWLSLLFQKFQILIPTLLILLLKKRWSVLSGLFGGCLVLLIISLAVVGVSGLESYLRLLVEMSSWVERKGIYPSQMHNLRGQFYVLFYIQNPFLANLLTVMASGALLVLLVKIWRGEWNSNSKEFDLKFSLLVTISLLVSPHLNFHDLACLLLPGLLVWRLSEERLWTASNSNLLRVSLIAIGFPVMLATLAVSDLVPIQLSVWGVMVAVFLMTRSLRALATRVE